MCTDGMPKPGDEAAQHRQDLQRGPPGTPWLNAGTGPMAERAPALTEHLTAAMAASKSMFFLAKQVCGDGLGVCARLSAPSAVLFPRCVTAEGWLSPEHRGWGAGTCKFCVFFFCCWHSTRSSFFRCFQPADVSGIHQEPGGSVPNRMGSARVISPATSAPLCRKSE